MALRDKRESITKYLSGSACFGNFHYLPKARDFGESPSIELTYFTLYKYKPGSVRKIKSALEALHY